MKYGGIHSSYVSEYIGYEIPDQAGTGTGIRYPSISIGALNIIFNVTYSICLAHILIVNRPCSVTNT